MNKKAKVTFSYRETLKHDLNLVCGAGLGSDYTGETSVTLTRTVRNLVVDEEEGLATGTVKVDRKTLTVETFDVTGSEVDADAEFSLA
jgi:hypothetical protein